jgi:hypothetical protein
VQQAGPRASDRALGLNFEVKRIYRRVWRQ